VKPTLDRLERAWASLPEGGTMTIAWPSLEIADEADRRAERPNRARPAPSARSARRATA
jgi:hypothetical protein